MIEQRNGERYVLMISKNYYGTQKKVIDKFIYNNDLMALFDAKNKHYDKERKDNSDFYYSYEFFDYHCVHYIKQNEFIGFYNDTPITCVCRWGRNGQKYVWQYISESKMKSLIKKYGVEQICDHTLWLNW